MVTLPTRPAQSSAGASLASLRGILIAGFLTLLALVAALGWVVYRDTIAPLRVKLVRGQNLLEKQEKLGTLAAGTLLREVHGLEPRGIELSVEPGPDLAIRADGGHLKQVLINLVRNASKAIDTVGVVRLRLRATRAVHGGRETDAVVLEVIDNGHGTTFGVLLPRV